MHDTRASLATHSRSEFLLPMRSRLLTEIPISRDGECGKQQVKTQNRKLRIESLEFRRLLARNFVADASGGILLRSGDEIVMNAAPHITVDEHWLDPSIKDAWNVLASGDFTGDGLPDLYGELNNGQVGLQVNDGEQLFFMYWGENIPAGSQRIGEGDVNGDGLLDIIAFDEARNELWVSVNSLDVGFTNHLWGTWEEADWGPMFVGDFDADGLTDVLRGEKDGSWWLAKSDANAFTTQEWGTFPFYDWQSVVAADYDGDNYLDVAARAPDETWWVWSGSESGLSTATYWGHWKIDSGFQNIRAADLNADGKDDLIGRSDAGFMWVASSKGDSFHTWRWATGWIQKANWQTIEYADVTGDGYLDQVGEAADGTWWIGQNQQELFRNHYLGRDLDYIAVAHVFRAENVVDLVDVFGTVSAADSPSTAEKNRSQYKLFAAGDLLPPVEDAETEVLENVTEPEAEEQLPKDEQPINQQPKTDEDTVNNEQTSSQDEPVVDDEPLAEAQPPVEDQPVVDEEVLVENQPTNEEQPAIDEQLVDNDQTTSEQAGEEQTPVVAPNANDDQVHFSVNEAGKLVVHATNEQALALRVESPTQSLVTFDDPAPFDGFLVNDAGSVVLASRHHTPVTFATDVELNIGLAESAEPPNIEYYSFRDRNWHPVQIAIEAGHATDVVSKESETPEEASDPDATSEEPTPETSPGNLIESELETTDGEPIADGATSEQQVTEPTDSPLLSVRQNSEKQLVVSGMGQNIFGGLQISSPNGGLIPGTSPKPFDFFLANSPTQVIMALWPGKSVTVDGDLVLDLHWNDEVDLSELTVEYELVDEAKSQFAEVEIDDTTKESARPTRDESTISV